MFFLFNYDIMQIVHQNFNVILPGIYSKFTSIFHRLKYTSIIQVTIILWYLYYSWYSKGLIKYKF